MMRLPLFHSNESTPSMVRDGSDLDGFTLMDPSDMPPSHDFVKVVGHLGTLGSINNNSKIENDDESILMPLDTGKYNGPLPTISLQPRLKKQRFIDMFYMDSNDNDNDDCGDDNDAQAESYEFRVHNMATPRLTPDRSNNIDLDTTESNADEFRASMPVLKRKRTVSEDSMVWPGETTTFVSPFPQTSLCTADSWTTPRPVSREQGDEGSHKDDQQEQQQEQQEQQGQQQRRRRYRKSFHSDAREITTTPRRLSKADQCCFFDVSPSEIQAFSLAFPILD